MRILDLIASGETGPSSGRDARFNPVVAHNIEHFVRVGPPVGIFLIIERSALVEESRAYFTEQRVSHRHCSHAPDLSGCGFLEVVGEPVWVHEGGGVQTNVGCGPVHFEDEALHVELELEILIAAVVVVVLAGGGGFIRVELVAWGFCFQLSFGNEQAAEEFSEGEGRVVAARKHHAVQQICAGEDVASTGARGGAVDAGCVLRDGDLNSPEVEVVVALGVELDHVESHDFGQGGELAALLLALAKEQLPGPPVHDRPRFGRDDGRRQLDERLAQLDLSRVDRRVVLGRRGWWCLVVALLDHLGLRSSYLPAYTAFSDSLYV